MLRIQKTLKRFCSTTPKPTNPNTPQNEPIDYEKILQEKQQEITELKDSYRRALAETENVRNRFTRQLQDAKKFAISKFATDLLSTSDVLQIALKSVPTPIDNKDLKNLYVGVELTRKELLKAFKNYDIQPFESLDKPFDFNYHEALFRAPCVGKETGTVFHVEKEGFMIADRVLRPASVGVVLNESKSES